MSWAVLASASDAGSITRASGDFLPHAVCYLWDPALLGLHASTDLLIGLSYVAISSTLTYLVYRARREIPFHWMVLAFGAFIVACGATHLMELWTLWSPRYWLAGGVKVVTAAASVATALLLPPLVPRALALVGAVRTSREHERNLRDSEARFRALLESAPDAIVIVEATGRIVLVNHQAEALFGYAREELLGENVDRLLPERFRARHAAHRAGYHADPRTRPMGVGSDLVVRRKDGSEFPAEISLSPLQTEEGLLVTTVVRDVTERKKAEEHRVQLAREQAARAEAEASERRASFLGEAGALLTSSLDYKATLARLTRLAVPRLADICSVDMVEGQAVHRIAVTHVDPSKEPFVLDLRRTHGYKPDAQSGVAEVLRTGRPALVRQVTDEHLVHAAQSPEQLQMLRALGMTSWLIVPLRSRGRVQGAITLVMADSGRTYGPADVVLAQDLAYRASVAIENAQLYAEAQAANRAKDEFLATLSHELRTPLNAIYGWARMLRAQRLSAADQERALAVIDRNAQVQTQLIEDLLDVSRIVTGKMRLHVQPIDPAQVVTQALDAIRPTAEAKQIRLHAVLDSRAAPLTGDPDRLQQVVWNLLTNAVKFTPRGGNVRVELRRVNSHIEIQVSDSGVGIEPHVLPLIFDRFTQADSSPTRDAAGLGIGLSLVRHLAELHGGTVEAHSEGPGTGATFLVKLPVAPIDTAAGRAHPTAVTPPGSPLKPNQLAGLGILVVDDDPDSLDLLGAMLGAAGARVEQARSVDSALQALIAGAPDIVVCDIEMPGENGYSLIRKVRATWGTQLPVIALTAYGRVADRVRTLSEGFNLHLTKPADPAELVAAVASLARGAGA